METTASWTPTNATLSSEADPRTGSLGSYCMQIVKNLSGAYASQQLTNVSGALLKWTGWNRGDATNKAVLYYGSTKSAWETLILTGLTSTTWTSNTVYRTTIDANRWFIINSYVTTSNYCRADDYSVTQVLTPSATGVTITTTKNGSLYNWTSEASGFNRNATSYTYQIWNY
jgi:hypothetical protein